MAASLDAFFAPMLDLARSHLDPPLSVGGRLLDLDCGNARRSASLRRPGVAYVGLDINVAALRQARDFTREVAPAVALVQGDVHALPFAAGSFDALFSLSVLQYGDAPTVLRECARVLKPGGKAVFIENLLGNPLARSYRALHRRLRWQYAPDMTPRAHLQWEQRGRFGDFFGQVEFTACHLMTPLAFVVPALKNRLWGRPMALHSLPLYRFLHGVDRRLLRRFPHLARWSWILVARVAKS